MNDMNLSERLKQARKNKGLSQSALARMIGTGQSTIASLENGDNKSTTRILDIAKVLNVSPNWLEKGGNLTTQTSNYQQKGVPIISWEDVKNLPTFPEKIKEYVSSEIPASPYYYALLIKNDLMTPLFQIGSIIIVDLYKKPQNGSFIIYFEKNEPRALLRKYTQDGNNIYLTPINTSYQSQLASKTISIRGTVTKVITSFD